MCKLRDICNRITGCDNPPNCIESSRQFKHNDLKWPTNMTEQYWQRHYNDAVKRI